MPVAQPAERRNEAMEARLANLQQLMEREDLDAVIVSSLQNVAYFGGVYIFTQMLVPDRHAYLVARRQGDPTLLVCDLEESLAQSESPVADIQVYVEFTREPAETLATLLLGSGLGSSRIGYDARRLPADAFRLLVEALPGAELVRADAQLEALQMRKHPFEVEELRRAARLTQAAIEDGIAGCSIGATEVELASRVTGELAAAGGALAFLVLGAGARAKIAHADPRDIELELGQVFRIDTGARFNDGLLSDMARTGVVGEPSNRQTQTLRTLADIQASVFDAVRPGFPVRRLFEICRSGFERANLPFNMPHIGHGLGIGLHEEPRLHPKSEILLEPGMVINVEPLLVVSEHSEAYHVEDLVLVTDDGYELLSTPQRTLLTIESS